MEHAVEVVYIKQEVVEVKVEVNDQVHSFNPYQQPEYVFNDNIDIKNSLDNKPVNSTQNEVINNEIQICNSTELAPNVIKSDVAQDTGFARFLNNESLNSSVGDEFNASNNRERSSIEITGRVFENGKKNRVLCPLCNNSFKNRENLKNHLKYVHANENDVVECKQCFRSFRSVSHLRSHINSVHFELEKKVACDRCDKTFANKKKWSNHVLYAHPEPEDSVSCEKCEKVFKSKYNLKVHQRLVHPPENSSVQCPICSKVFKVDMLLQRHIKWSHSNDGITYKCQQCGRVLPSLACYKKHLANVHRSKTHICEICKKAFKTETILKTHVRRIHSDQKLPVKEYKPGDHACDKCEKRFSTNTALLWHFQRCHSEAKRSVTCEVCNKQLADYNGLKVHMEMVHSMEKVTCYICQKDFKSQLNLDRHIRVTHAPPEAAKICDVCNKTFKCGMHLRIHKSAVHAKDGKGKCDICDKEFSSRKYLIKHKKTHVVEKNFPCPTCLKMYKSQDDVRKHRKRVHNKPSDETAPLPNRCRVCETSFETQMDLSQHVYMMHYDMFSRTCFKCGQMFLNDEQLHNHILSCGTSEEEEEAVLEVKREVLSGEEGNEES